jgi:hypothetical protein
MSIEEDKHTAFVGRLVVNLQSLEFLLRGFLSTIHEADSNGLIPGMPQEMYNLKIGDEVPVNYLTNYEPLGKIMDKYNNYIKPRDASLLLDRNSLVDLRDAIAHGRVSGAIPSSSIKIIKFRRPKDGRVKIMFLQTMDTDWFERQIKFVYDEAMKTYRACKLFAPSMIV